MRVSVVVPVRDGERHLAEALASVAAQTHAALELIVVDDGSADGSAALAEDHGARVVRQAASGQAAARNRGVALASGELVAFLDADDVWTADSLERRVAAMDDADLVFGRAREFGVGASQEPRPALLPGTMLMRRDAFERVGPFATEWRVGELMEWLFRAREAGLRERMIDDVVLHRRLHDTNIGRQRGTRIDHVRIVRQALERRRGVGG